MEKWLKSINNLVEELYNGSFKNTGSTAIEKTVLDLLSANFILWGYEDEARRKDVPDSCIAELKRKIDKENQSRNDIIDALDALIRQDVEEKLKSIDQTLPMNSENPGSLYDRLTILALRSYNLKKEINRKDADIAHIERCSNMLEQVLEKSDDLLKCLKELMDDIYSGRKKIKAYKQHKLYNDPALNPALRK
ncbi:MAG: hypothetical protein UT63_C0113G0004 [Candidatus Gottesmanbacteria bacterium GW2011_GWC2_39_8]|uniref:DUF4254 domain-containing protein n=1 Tax=Candidatus Gottesmanbacteria bacterium GW2011_GWC2_39_8 TaxID=1618450 RepID=A0A0G0PPN1_9BACT|nr:MAG: hypothetical protein UT63_C0113G0004 [Candidatus Gottesmanbacteria bacterium GW2011_GWC2_39_8]